MTPDSNRSRAKARERRQAEQHQALKAVVEALNDLSAAEERVKAARQGVDVALAQAVQLHVPSQDLIVLFEVSPATFWRRAKAAREAADR